MASLYSSRGWGFSLSPTSEEIRVLADQAYRSLPDHVRSLTGDLTIRIEDFPDDEVMEELGCETPFDLLGLFQGSPATGSEEPVQPINEVLIYRRALLDYWAEQEETLGAIVTHVLVNEIGHHFGLSDEDIARLEEDAQQDASAARTVQ